jgi:hypothetical protein
VSLGDSIRRFFAKKRSPELKELEAFAREHKGVEGYIEPRTATHPTTLLLVDRGGDNYRGEVLDPEDAVSFCERLGIPVYDAKVVGYPQRMRDFDLKGRRATTEDVDAKIAEIEKRLRESGPPGSND